MPSFRRRPAEDADADRVVELVAAFDVALLGSSDYTLADLRDEWQGIDAGDRWVVVEGDTIVGYGTVEARQQHAQVDGYVHPTAFGRGVGSLLVTELEREVLARGRTRVQNAVLGVDARAQELLRGHGYDEIRRFWQMRIELDEPPEAPAWPDGVSVSSFDPADAEEFHAALEAAFADHWQHDTEPFDKWRRETIERGDFSPELWTVVRAGGEIVAGTVCALERNGVAWVGRLFTTRAWRRRGVGEALLHDAFGRFWHAGKRTIGLGVDAQSDTGAQRLYERVGMHVHFGAAIFEKSL